VSATREVRSLYKPSWAVPPYAPVWLDAKRTLLHIRLRRDKFTEWLSVAPNFAPLSRRTVFRDDNDRVHVERVGVEQWLGYERGAVCVRLTEGPAGRTATPIARPEAKSARARLCSPDPASRTQSEAQTDLYPFLI
jgi:hypothetical protein